MKRMTLLILVFPLVCIAQEFNFVFEPDSIPVEIDGWQPFCPWAGGVSESNPAIVDIDADGDLDFFIGEFVGYIIFYQNKGSITVPEFTFVTSQFDSIYLDEARSNPCFRDLDNDGDLDLVVGDSDANVNFYRNEGTAQSPIFVFETSSLVPPGPPWCWGPELVDIDADGDYDLFGGWEQITFYRNEGTPDSFAFNLVTVNFAGVNVSEWASVDFEDIDSDNDFDLFIGERYGKIWYYRNDGDSANYDFTYVTDYFDSIDVGDYASPEFADIDGDGDFDLFVGSESYFSSSIGCIFFYENVGSPTNFLFEFVTSNYLTLDVGTAIDEPQVVDINGDEDADLFADLNTTIGYFENVGNSQSASFQFITDSFEGISLNSILPYFVDLDNDLDYDIVCGTAAIPGPPTLALYQNYGTPSNPDIRLYDPQFVTNPNFWVAIVPVLADIDADEDYDLFISDNDGHFFFYQNIGTPQLSIYSLVTSQWQGIQFSYPYDGSKCFAFADLDEDSDLDLFMTSPFQKSLYFYRNIGTPQSANMVLENEEFLIEYNLYVPCPYFVDIDSDSDLDLFIGEINGGIKFFRNLGDSVSVGNHASIHPSSFTLHPCFPNPFNPTTTILFTLDRALPVRVMVYNGLGQCVVTLIDGQMTSGEHQVRWDAGMYSSGVYFYRLTTGRCTMVKKMILAK
ncbi:MAG: T9SS type A sorting domain-containing protein [candidate division Zixibacteria bacterium]|nr:T9SS type A sorting domain-containing protein [Candidatus Tariuqbacter arcticus]